MMPFCKWAGGKRLLAPMLVKEIEDSNPKLYVEPFLGAGAVALAVPSYIPKVLSDINPTIIDVWRCLQKSGVTLVEELHRIEKVYKDTQEGYLKARDELNGIILDPRPFWFHRAALFLYINARCFNGLWRTNSSGFFNVPFGKYDNPKNSSIDVEDANLYQLCLKNVVLSTCPFHTTCHEVVNKTKLAVYFDPPYDDTFEGYAKEGFGKTEQRELAEWFFYLVKKGAKCWLTNSDTPLIRELYANAKIESLDETHVIGAAGASRGKRSCLLIRGG